MNRILGWLLAAVLCASTALAQDKKISDLTALTTADATDVLPIVDLSATETKKITAQNLANSLKTLFTPLSLTTDVTGTLAIGHGGLGLTSGTSGGVLYFSGSTTLASSGAFTANQLLFGGGAGAAPVALGSLGTTTTLLHGNAGGLPTFGQVSLTADVSGILPAANGGTENGFTAFTGPSASTKTFTLPNASATIAYLNGAQTFTGGLTINGGLTMDTALSIGNGGTGQTTKAPAFNALSPLTTAGDLLYGGASGAGTRLAAGSSTQVLHSGTTPLWAAVSLTADVSGTLPLTNGGIGITSGTSGGVLYFSDASTVASSAALTSNRLLVGAGAASAPAVLGSLGTTTTLLHGNAAGLPTFGAVALAADVSGTLPIGNGGTGQTTKAPAFDALQPMTTAGDIIYGGSSGTGTRLAAGTSAQVLYSGTTPAWGAVVVTPVVQTTTATGATNNLALTTNVAMLRFNNATLITVSGFSAGVDGQVLDVESIGAGMVSFLHQSASSTSTGRMINFVTSAATNLAAGVGTARFIYDGTTARWRMIAHVQGDWIVPAYASGDFTSNTGTWTVQSGDRLGMAYYVEGRKITVTFQLDSTDITGSPFFLLIGNGQWGGYTANGPAIGVYGSMGFAEDNAVSVSTYVRNTSATSVDVGLSSVTGWTATTAGCFARGTITFILT